MLKLIEKMISFIEDTLGLFFLAAMVVMVALQVLSRYVMQSPLSWTEEGARYCLIWITFIGASMAIRTRGHFSVELLIKKLPKKLIALGELILLFIMAIFAWILFFKGFSILSIVHYQMSPALNIPMSWVYLSIPTGSLLMLCRIVIEMTKKSCEFLEIFKIEGGRDR